MEKFIEDVKNGNSDEKGWPHTCYGISKIGVSILSQIQAKEMKKPGVLVNNGDPGWCRTDMAGESAPRSAAQGAETPCYLALLPEGSKITGKFYGDCQERPLYSAE